MTDAPFLSIIVLCFRNRSTVVDAVQSLVTQECTEPFQVVLAASGDDGSTALVRERFPDVTVVDSPQRLLVGGRATSASRRAPARCSRSSGPIASRGPAGPRRASRRIGPVMPRSRAQ